MLKRSCLNRAKLPDKNAISCLVDQGGASWIRPAGNGLSLTVVGRSSLSEGGAASRCRVCVFAGKEWLKYFHHD